MESQLGEYRISTDPNLLDIDMIHDFLCNHSYWAAGIPRDVVKRSVEGALCFGVYLGERQVGFARVITDFATIAYLGDVFILEDFRGQGLSKWLMACILSYPRLQGLRRFLLATADAHGLYAQFGFKPLARPERWMEWHNPKVYLDQL